MEQTRRAVLAASLVASPLLILAYWLSYPAYGEQASGSTLRALASHPSLTGVSDVFALTGAFLAVPASLALMRVLSDDGRQFATLYHNVLTNPLVIALNVVATLHVVGGLVLGIAVVRNRLVPRPLAVATAAAAPVHLVANLSGQLWLDSATWLIVAVAGVWIGRVLLHELAPAHEDRQVRAARQSVRASVLQVRSREP